MISDELAWWLPAASVLALTTIGLLAARGLSAGPARAGWLAGIALCGALAVAFIAWERHTSRGALQSETERLREVWARLDELGKQLPAGPGANPAETFDTVSAAIRSLNVRIADLDEQIRALQEKSRGRSIEPQTAAKVAQYLRQFAPQRVVVSCVPDDVEAFSYANQIATMLRDGGWDALGPEKTAMFGDAPAMAVKLFVRSAGMPPDAARILIDVFSRFNIPHQSGVAPSPAIPDPATTELFVSRKS